MRWMVKGLIAFGVFFGLNALGIVDDAVAQESRRIDRLEKRLDEQDAKMDRILEILTGQQSGQANGTEKSEPTSQDEYTPGWILRIYSAPQGFEASSGLPQTELGSVDANKAGYDFAKDPGNLLGLAVNEGTFWRGEGLLPVTQQGNYTFFLNIFTDMRQGGWGAIRIDGKEIASGQGSLDFNVIGGVELTPGLHTVDLRVVPGLENDLRVSRAGMGKFEFSIKSPENRTPISAHEILLRKIRK